MFKPPNPEMLVVARLSRGISQVETAEQIGVSAGMLSKWENGVVEPPHERLRQLADALSYPTDLFYQPERVRGTDSICFHHRKRKSMPVRLLDQVEASMHLAQLQANRLLRHLEVENSLEFLTLDPDEHGGPQEVAQALRGYWRIPRGPIRNMTTLVEAAGCVVRFTDFRTRKLDGMSGWGKGTPPLFFINSLNPVDRSRWTIAHELGHLVMHQSTITEGDPESEANAFAQEFLLPGDEIKPALRRVSFSNLPSLKAKWRVSMKALIKTAEELSAIPPGRAKSLYVQYSRAGFNRGEPFPLEAEPSSVLRDAVSVHLSQHGYTVAELARVVHLTPAEFAQCYDIGSDEGQQRLHIV